MNSRLIFVLLAVAVIAISGCAQQQNNSTGVVNTGQTGQGNNATENGSELAVGTFTIEKTDQGYAPSPLTIKKGSMVNFVNNSSQLDWPASARHPTHTVYPGSDIQKCGTSEESGIFDACRGIPAGEKYSFTFNSVGEWGYHDHLDATKFGKIIVVE